MKKTVRKPIPYQWLSFAENGFLGVVILRARNGGEAVDIAWRLGINPGGEAACWTMPESWSVPDEAVGKLLSRADCERLFPNARCKSIAEHEADSRALEKQPPD